jgi:protoheme ferro-lyase
MADDAEVLKSVEKLPANEQAAALAHWIYTQTTHRDDTTWSARVAEAWSALGPEPKRFNILAIDTWVEHPELLQAWINAVHDYGKRHISKQSQGTQKPSAIG